MKLNIFRVLSTFLVVSMCSCSPGTTSTYEDFSKIIKDSDDVTVYIYGDEMIFDFEINEILVNEISEVQTENSKNYLVINFTESTFNLSHEDMIILEELIVDNELVVIYSGFGNYSNNILDSELNLLYENESFTDVEVYLYDPANTFSVSTSENGGFYILDFIVYHLRGTN